MQALVIHPTGAGTALAAAALAAGAPLFSDGLHALRMRRRFRRLRYAALADEPAGLTHVSGRVALESPLFAPLSGRPCAGYRLEVSTAERQVAGRVDAWRDFRIVDDAVDAHVEGHAASWDLMVTAWREVAPGEALTANLHALLGQVPETRWLRDSGAPLRLVEHALLAGATCHVVGFAQRADALAHAPVLAAAAEQVFVRTGTDDVAVPADGGAVALATVDAPGLWLGPGEHHDFLLVSDAPPRPERLRISGARLGGLALGPALSLAGMLYLAHAADWLRARGGF